MSDLEIIKALLTVLVILNVGIGAIMMWPKREG